MKRLSNWLCPTPEQRARVVEASPRIRKARIVTACSIGIGNVIAIPWVGLVPIAMFVPAAIHLVTMDRLMNRSERPELIALGTLTVMAGMLGVAAVITGGPQSPVLTWLAIIPAMGLLRFRWGVGRALACAVALLIVGVSVASDPGSLADDPLLMTSALVMLACIVAVTNALMEGELEHRGRAVVDPLTSLLNRTALATRIPEIEQQARLTGAPVCLIVCDIDRFKRVNDTYGHERGDFALRDVAYAIRKSLRSFELVYRIGGEELLIVLPGADLVDGKMLAERIRAAVADARPGGLDLTLSAGVASGAGPDVTYEALFRAADEALLEAKRAGRDRTVASGPLTAPLAA
jgi:diguanylate cyclase (GGDEF)-like protein